MVQTVRFVDGVSYTEADQADFQMRMMRPQGVIPESSLGTLIGSSIGTMYVRIGAGEAFIQGFHYKNDVDVDLLIANNSSGSTRMDRIVLSLNRAANTLLLAVVQGVPGAGLPSLTQVVGGNWEFPLYNVTVTNNAVSITSGNLSDVRVFSRWPVSALDTTLITESELTTINSAMQTVLQGNIDTEASTRASADSAEITARTNAINTEATTRANNDNAEASARASADSALSSALGTEQATRSSNDAAEASARSTMDNILQTSINNINDRPWVFCCGYIGANGTIAAQYNVTSISHPSTGVYNISFTGGPGHIYFIITGVVHNQNHVIRMIPVNGNLFVVTITEPNANTGADSNFSFALIRIPGT